MKKFKIILKDGKRKVVIQNVQDSCNTEKCSKAAV